MKSKSYVLPGALGALGFAIIFTNRWFPAVDDECAIIDRAAQPVSYTIRLYFGHLGEHEHPPLYDLILHGWLRLTHGRMDLLRVPAIVFYLLGIWFLVAAAKRLGGYRAATWALILTILWPYGFHFGRVAAWYSFVFFLVSLLTWVYLGYLERSTLLNWVWVLFCALALVYSNYFGWALVGLLLIDLYVRDPDDFLGRWRRLLCGGILLVAAYVPVLKAFQSELHRGIHPQHSLLAMSLLGIYNLYCIFVSESVAPWFWMLGVPACIAVTISLIVTLRCAPSPAKRFLFYFGCLLGSMTILGIVATKRTLFIAPWLILSLAVVLGGLPKSSASRRACLLSLIVVAGIGWYGIFARSMYAAPHWVEPWNGVAQEAVGVANSDGIVIGNNISFFFYLTYSLPEQNQLGTTRTFAGLLPNSMRRKRIYDPEQWLSEGMPLGPTVFLVEGLHYDVPADPTEEVERSLTARCVLKNSRKLVHDPGATWKERFVPKMGQIPWRIHLYTFSCPQ